MINDGGQTAQLYNEFALAYAMSYLRMFLLRILLSILVIAFTRFWVFEVDPFYPEGTPPKFDKEYERFISWRDSLSALYNDEMFLVLLGIMTVLRVTEMIIIILLKKWIQNRDNFYDRSNPLMYDNGKLKTYLDRDTDSVLVEF